MEAVLHYLHLGGYKARNSLIALLLRLLSSTIIYSKWCNSCSRSLASYLRPVVDVGPLRSSLLPDSIPPETETGEKPLIGLKRIGPSSQQVGESSARHDCFIFSHSYTRYSLSRSSSHFSEGHLPRFFIVRNRLETTNNQDPTMAIISKGKVAICQITSTDNVPHNLEISLEVCRRAAEAGAEVGIHSMVSLISVNQVRW